MVKILGVSYSLASQKSLLDWCCIEVWTFNLLYDVIQNTKKHAEENEGELVV